MFRNRRDNAARHANERMTPSTGRPPTPQASHQPVKPSSTPLSRKMAAKALAPTSARKTSTPKSNGGQPKNGNILSFFKKADRTTSTSIREGGPLFVEGANYGDLASEIDSIHDSGFDEGLFGTDGNNGELESDRFNENGGSNKRRKLSASSSESKDAEAMNRPDAAGTGARACSSPPPDFNDQLPETEGAKVAEEATAQPKSHSGPFVEDSDSDDGDQESPGKDQTISMHDVPTPDRSTTTQIPIKEEAQDDDTIGNEPGPPRLRRYSTSYAGPDGFDGFEGMGDFDDEYEEGDENAEKRWQMEQRRLETSEQGFDGEMDDDLVDHGLLEVKQEGDIDVQDGATEDAAPKCPICSASFEGVSDQEASIHVNHCLDGNPTPLAPKQVVVKTEPASTSEVDQAPGPKFRRLVRPAKPGQENPFTLGQANGTSSAFGKLMSGHAEDEAWALAAAAEQSSRGRPAYMRTCPFYKILPGFNICVDAFRYGAVEGCKAYFLSHFHSDHYIGLTSTWCHGPIYCSRPTANLVRQQLRVDPRWIIDLEFEKKVEVPGSNGVHVTMIPANHCPGSSLYLFEKMLNKGKTPKAQRVLHCGDFRACPAHVEHSLLKPDVIDSISGQTAQQKIDVCYLDTTYLNPKYAFPSQEDVTQACADMCVSLNKAKVDKDDGFEQMKAQRAGGKMTKFVRQESKEDHLPDHPAVEDSPVKPAARKESMTEAKARGPLLVVVGTYSIGKERICLGIARALNSLIYAPAGKQRICAALEDEELLSRLTNDPRKAQVHMTPLFEIRAESLGDYLAEYSDRFTRAVAFRPSGWNYRPPGSRFTESPAVGTVLYSENWKSGYSMRDLMPQRGSNQRTATYGVPYSEHSSFRELTMFCCSLRIDKVIPTVNVGSAKSREKMKLWVERWNTWKKKEGLFRPGRQSVMEGGGVKSEEEDQQERFGQKSEWYAGKGTWELRTTL